MTRVLFLALATACLAACGSPPKSSADFPLTGWDAGTTGDAYYLLAPGDTLEVIVHSAPELSRSLTVAPDGRIRLPLAPAIMVTARTPDEVAADLMTALSGELIDPDLDIVVTGFASQQIFVGGEVSQQGIFDLPGQIDPLQAVIMAGGFTRDARKREVVLMRRLPGGEVRTALIDLSRGIGDPALASWLPLRRFDVVYVPRSRISEQNQFVQQYIRDALPVQFSLFYDVSGGNR